MTSGKKWRDNNTRSPFTTGAEEKANCYRTPRRMHHPEGISRQCDRVVVGRGVMYQ